MALQLRAPAAFPETQVQFLDSQGLLQRSLTPVPGDMTPSSGL